MEGDHTFEFGPFVLDPLAHTFIRDGEEIPLPPKAFAVLLLLVRNAGRVVTKDEINREVWGHVSVEEQNIPLNIHLARKAIGDNAERPTYIATVARLGYRFVAPVVIKERVTSPLFTTEVKPPELVEVSAPGASTAADMTSWVTKNETLGQSTTLLRLLRSALTEDRWFLLTSCTLYALLYAIALFVEVAYQFDSHAASAVKVAPFVFLWVWVTSIASLITCKLLTSTGRSYSLVLSVLLFVAASLTLYVSIGSILPNVPITRALIRTYPAHGAYFKSITHFFPLAVIFWVVPYHFVIAARTQIRSGRASQIRELLTGDRYGTAPEGTVFLHVKWLGVLLMVAAAASIYATAHLMDNLVPTEYTSMFTQLIQWRLILYFAMGVICLLWYSRSLNAIKIASIEKSC